MKLLSIIIPVYNVEKYIEECLNSISKQINEFCEVILVDDGSTDSSAKFCDTFCENNCKYCKVIHKTNGGLSSARNSGLKIAVGKYIAFIDSDDRIASNSITLITEWIKNTNSNADICFMKAVKFYENNKIVDMGDKINYLDIHEINKDDVISFLSTRPKFPGSACTKLFKREFLTKNNLYFEEQKRTNEDLGFTIDCIIKAESYEALDFPYYEYRQNRKGSITASNREKLFWSIATFVTEYKEKIHKYGNENRNYLKLMTFVTYEYLMLFIIYSNLNGGKKNDAYKYLKNNIILLHFSIPIKQKISSVVIYILGIRLSSIFMRSYITLRHKIRLFK